MTVSLTELAIAATKQREQCTGDNCPCNEYSRRMYAFRQAATPEVFLRLLNDRADLQTQLDIALDELVAIEDPTLEIEMAIETIRGK